MTVIFVSIICILLFYSFFVTLLNRELVAFTDKLEDNYRASEQKLADERKDLYNRLMSKDLADYHHHTTPKDKSKKPTNFLEDYRKEAFRLMDE